MKLETGLKEVHGAASLCIKCAGSHMPNGQTPIPFVQSMPGMNALPLAQVGYYIL